MILVRMLVSSRRMCWPWLVLCSSPGWFIFQCVIFFCDRLSEACFIGVVIGFPWLPYSLVCEWCHKLYFQGVSWCWEGGGEGGISTWMLCHSPIIWQMIKLDVPLVLFVLSVQHGQDWAQYCVTTYIEHQSPSANFHISHWWSMKKKCSGNFNSHWLRKILCPLSSFHSCDWPNCLQSYYINDRIFFSPIISLSNKTNSITLKMEAVHTSETFKHLATAWCRNPKEDHQVGNTCCENL